MTTVRSERCPTCKRLIRRSTDQNKRLWALYHVMSSRIKPRGEAYSADQWHLYCKTKFLGAEDVKLPSGKVLVMPLSTADLDTAAFGDYMTKVEAFANEHGAFLEDEIWTA
jgi:hypothetical protein